jgi:uncharacterized protein
VACGGEPVLIFETVHGSTAFGLARDGSDVDLKGIVIGPADWYVGWRGGPEQVDLSPDHVRYELRKFFRLAADANPTALEMLFVDPSHHCTLTAAGCRLLDARDLFVSKRVADRFGRYAVSQLKRIRTHRGWLLDPPKSAPTRGAFGLPERTVIPADQLAAAQTLIDGCDLAAADVSANFLDLLDREKRYKNAQAHWQRYNDWLRNRNPRRSAIEARFGYDTKHAMHLVRIQRMAFEALSTGTVKVTRADRDELLAIRDGVWTFDELEARTNELSERIENAARASALPDDLDLDSLDALCVELVMEHIAC